MYAIRARIVYMNYTKKLRIFNILNLFCVVYLFQLYRLYFNANVMLKTDM